MVKIACVSYHNTTPYIYAFDHFLDQNLFELERDVPAICAEKFKQGKVQISLLPVGVLPELEEYTILDNYSISCDGEVRTVCIFSHVPIEQLNTIILDQDSRSSNLLAQILMKEHWKVEAKFKHENEEAFDQHCGRILIGDKVFEAENKYAYKYDLGTHWKIHTGLPFVFAVWVSLKEVDKQVIIEMERAFVKSFNKPEQWLPKKENDPLNLSSYLTKHIKFDFDDRKKESLDLYLSKTKSL